LKNSGQNVLITSNSWGGGGFSQTLKDAMAGLNHPTMSPILHVAAAGNDGVNTDISPHYPSSYDLDNIISVAYTDRNDNYSPFSNYGPTTVDLAAPGVIKEWYFNGHTTCIWHCCINLVDISSFN
jgi:hypothetical protein